MMHVVVLAVEQQLFARRPQPPLEVAFVLRAPPAQAALEVRVGRGQDEDAHRVRVGLAHLGRALHVEVEQRGPPRPRSARSYSARRGPVELAVDFRRLQEAPPAAHGSRRRRGPRSGSARPPSLPRRAGARGVGHGEAQVPHLLEHAGEDGRLAGARRPGHHDRGWAGGHSTFCTCSRKRLDLRLQGHHVLYHLRGRGLAADGVGLPRQLLGQEVEALARGSLRPPGPARLGHVAAQPLELLLMSWRSTSRTTSW